MGSVMHQELTQTGEEGKRRFRIADDLLPSLDAIAEYTGESPRRLRYMISAHGFPAGKVAGRFQALASNIDSWYAARLGSPSGS